MRGDELLDVLENINPTLIERASRKPKRPWLRWTAAAACLLMLVGLCALFLPGNLRPLNPPSNPSAPVLNGPTTIPNDPTQPPQPIIGQPSKYTIYASFVSVDVSPGVPDGSIGPPPDIQPDTPNDSPPSEGNTTPSVNYIDISDLDFSYSHRNNFVNSSAAPSVELSFAGRELYAEYSRSFTNSLYQNDDPQLQLLGSFDDYRGDNYSVRIRQQDGGITFFVYFDDRDVGGNLTEQQAKEMADAFVTEQFGEGFLTEYAAQSIVPSSDNRKRTISVAYTKTICGYNTTDRVIVTYNMRGEIVGYNANTKGVFYAAYDVITPEAIAAAEEYLLSHVSSEWHIGEKKLVMDAGGTFYLYVGMIKYQDGLAMPAEMCINIT